MYQKSHLICIPFAGGTSFAFRDIKNHLPDHILPTCIEFPGHGRRIREPLVNDLHDLVSDTFHQLPRAEDAPLIIWGHSMGGTIAWLLARRLFLSGHHRPLHLFVSGAPAPSVPRKDKDVYKLPRHAFLEKVKTYGGVTDEVLAEKDLMDLFLPILRADFQALETYVYSASSPLPLPITALLGSWEHVKKADAEPWQYESSFPITIREFEGNHFFFFDHLQTICDMIVQVDLNSGLTQPKTQAMACSRAS